MHLYTFIDDEPEECIDEEEEDTTRRTKTTRQTTKRTRTTPGSGGSGQGNANTKPGYSNFGYLDDGS